MRTYQPSPRGQAPPVTWRQWLLPLGAAAGIVGLLTLSPGAPSGVPLSYSQFLTDVGAGAVRAVTINPAGQVTGSLATGQPFTTTIPVALGDRTLTGQLAAHHVQVTATTATSSSPLPGLIGLLLLVMIGGLFYVGVRGARREAAGPRGLTGMGELTKANTRIIDAERPATRFADVAGYAAVKTEIGEVVDYLRDPGRYRAAGARGPRGVLMAGPPPPPDSPARTWPTWSTRPRWWRSGPGRTGLIAADFASARDRVVLGTRDRSATLTRAELATVAVHEAGHALVATLSPDADPVSRVTVLGAGRALGLTEQLPADDRRLYGERYLADALAVRLGGRAAELLVRGEASTGAADDLASATALATQMVRQFGLSQAIGPVSYAGAQTWSFSGPGAPRGYSEHTQWLIDREVAALLTRAEARARELLTGHMQALHQLTTALVERETITGDQVRALVRAASPPSASADRPDPNVHGYRPGCPVRGWLRRLLRRSLASGAASTWRAGGAAMAATAILAGAAATHRTVLAASLATLGHVRWIWIPAVIVLESVSIAALAGMQRRLLAAGGASVGARPMLATTFAANALSVSVPLAGPELGTARSALHRGLALRR